MVSASVGIPRELVPAFRRFQRDFDRVTEAWVCDRVETRSSVEAARAGLRAYIADPSDPDDDGISRVDRLRALFEFWSALVERTPGLRVGVVPVLSAAAEERIAAKLRSRRGWQ